MVDAAAEFKKSGYSDEDAKQLALISQMYTNVADEALSAGESANFIISQMKAFNLEASDAEHIIDAVFYNWPLRGELRERGLISYLR